MKGYWDMPDETAQVLSADGWLRTGDLVTADADGIYTFVGRDKEVIRRRGENVAPAEIEEALADHPAVFEAAVVGVPSELSEEEIKAFVVLHDADADLAAVREHAAGAARAVQGAALHGGGRPSCRTRRPAGSPSTELDPRAHARGDRLREESMSTSDWLRTDIGTTTADSITVRGHDLAGELMGRVTFTELAFLLVQGRMPDGGRDGAARRRARLARRPRPHADRARGAAHATPAPRSRCRAPWPRGCSGPGRSSWASSRTRPCSWRTSSRRRGDGRRRPAGGRRCRGRGPPRGRRPRARPRATRSTRSRTRARRACTRSRRRPGVLGPHLRALAMVAAAAAASTGPARCRSTAPARPARRSPTSASRRDRARVRAARAHGRGCRRTWPRRWRGRSACRSSATSTRAWRRDGDERPRRTARRSRSRARPRGSAGRWRCGSPRRAPTWSSRDVRDRPARGRRADRRRDRRCAAGAPSSSTPTRRAGTTSTGSSRGGRAPLGRLDVMVNNAIVAGPHSKGLLETGRGRLGRDHGRRPARRVPVLQAGRPADARPRSRSPRPAAGSSTSPRSTA